jgi:hypothetical protein
MRFKMLDTNLKNEWLERVKRNKNQNVNGKRGGFFSINTELHFAPDEVKADYDINLTAALVGKEFLWNIHDDFRKDKNFILELINHNYSEHIYGSLDHILSKDKELFLKCVERNDSFRWGLNDEILNNRELILEAMKINDIFTRLEDKYNLDKEIVQLHLQSSPYSFKNLKKSMKNYFSSPKRKDLIIELMNKSNSENYVIYKELSLPLQEDLEIIDALLNKSKNNFYYIPESLQNDKAFNLYAIDKYEITSVNDEMKKDRDIAERFISKNGELLKHFVQFQNDSEMIELAFKTYKKLDILTATKLGDKDLVIKFLKADPSNCKTLIEKTKEHCEDFDVMKLCVEYDGKLITHSKTLRNNPELSDLALASSQDFNLLSNKHIQSKNLVLQILKSDDKNCKKAVENEVFLDLYWNDRDIAELVVSHDTYLIRHFPVLKADLNFINFAISKGLSNLDNIDKSLQNNKELMLNFCRDSIVKYINLPLILKNDHDIALSFLNDTSNYKYIIRNSGLADDKEFTLKAISQTPEIFFQISINSVFKTDPDIIVKYIESCQIQEKSIRLPDNIYDFYETNDPLKIKSTILQQQLEDSLTIQAETKVKKLKL